MATRDTGEFRRDAVRSAVTSGLTRPQVASDFGVALSTLNTWVQKPQHDDLMSGPHEGVEKENERLRKEVRLLREEREVFKKDGNLLCGPKQMRFAFIDAWKEVWPVEFLCRIMQVTSRGVRAWRSRPMRRRQRDDMVILAHVREEHRPSLQSYGRPRRIEELQQSGLKVGHRRIGRLMRENGITIIRTQKYKVEEGQDMIRGIMSPTTDGQQSCVRHCAQAFGSGFLCGWSEPEMGGRHLLYLDE